MKLIAILRRSLWVAAIACPLAYADPLPGSKWVEPTTGMEFVFIPAGCISFNQYKACLSGFYISVRPTTQVQYEKITGSKPIDKQYSEFAAVSQKEVEGLIKRLPDITGEKLRLPTIWEMRHACASRSDQPCPKDRDNVVTVYWTQQYESFQDALGIGDANPIVVRRDLSGRYWGGGGPFFLIKPL